MFQLPKNVLKLVFKGQIVLKALLVRKQFSFSFENLYGLVLSPLKIKESRQQFNCMKTNNTMPQEQKKHPISYEKLYLCTKMLTYTARFMGNTLKF